MSVKKGQRPSLITVKKSASRERSGRKSPSRTNIEIPRREKDAMGIKRIKGAAYLVVRREWWMEGKMRVTKFSERSNFDL